MIEDAESFLSKLFTDEAVQHRMTMVAFASTSYHRVATRSISRISDWQEFVERSYEVLSKRPALTHIPLGEEYTDAPSQIVNPAIPKDHRAYTVRSVIDVHAWDRAQWRGIVYAQFSPYYPPCMAFLFENEQGARKIFERWRERFGTQDVNEEISLSIVRQLPQRNEHHYCVLITSQLRNNKNQNKVMTIASRSLIMEPDSRSNLEKFLESYKHFGAFYILPAFFDNSGAPEFASHLGILKQNLAVKLASDVSDRDVEVMALRGYC